MLRRIALFSPGGVTPEGIGVHIPSLYRIVSALSRDLDITVYSLAAFDPSAGPIFCGRARVQTVSTRHDDHWIIKIFTLLRIFVRDHSEVPYAAVHGMLGLIPELTALLAARLTGIPCVTSLFGGETASIPHIRYGSLRTPVLRTIANVVINRVDAVTVLTHFQEKELFELGFMPKHLAVIPHGYDITEFSDQAKEIPHAPVRFLHVASLTPVKDQRTLLHAFKLVQERVPALLRIIGGDYMEGVIQQYARDLGISAAVEFLGHLPFTAVQGHFHWADILLHTSLHEGQGVVFVEAALTRTLIAGTKVGLLSDFDDTMAVRVAPGDAEGLSRLILELMGNRDEIQRRVQRALEWAQRNDIRSAIRKYTEVYSHVIK